MTTTKAHHRASRITLAVIWQLIILISSTHAQTESHLTQDDPSDACTRAPINDGSTGAPVARFPCLSFAPLSTTPTELTSSLPFSFSAQETPPTLSSSTAVSQSVNSTSDHAVSTSTLYTTLQGNDQATSTSSPDQFKTASNGTISSHETTNTILSQNSTMTSDFSIPTTALPQDGGGATNTTTLPVVLQTVTYTTTICPSDGWVG